jgi:hypothetical protein
MKIIGNRKTIIITTNILIIIIGAILFYRQVVAISKEKSTQGLTVADFHFITHDTSLNEIYERVGEPQRDYCSGLYCPQYDLSDGNTIIISTGDPKHIWRVVVIDKNGEVIEELLSQ